MRLTLLLLATLGATAQAQSAISGVVLDAGKPVDAATVHAERSDRSVVRDAVTDSLGRFRLGPLTPGSYTVSVRRVGYRSAELPNVRVPEARVVYLSVALTQAPRQLSTIEVISSPTSIDA